MEYNLLRLGAGNDMYKYFEFLNDPQIIMAQHKKFIKCEIDRYCDNLEKSIKS